MGDVMFPCMTGTVVLTSSRAALTMDADSVTGTDPPVWWRSKGEPLDATECRLLPYDVIIAESTVSLMFASRASGAGRAVGEAACSDR